MFSNAEDKETSFQVSLETNSYPIPTNSTSFTPVFDVSWIAPAWF
jgi:hypothetical protein